MDRVRQVGERSWYGNNVKTSAVSRFVWRLFARRLSGKASHIVEEVEIEVADADADLREGEAMRKMSDRAERGR